MGLSPEARSSNFTAGVTFIMGVPGADDVTLNDQSTSFQEQLYLRDTLSLKRPPVSRPGSNGWASLARMGGSIARAAPVVAHQARVARGDEVGARLVIVLIGQRPGFSAADSFGAYLTFGPRVGRSDAERNRVSNIRTAGLPSAAAAATITWLAQQALVLSLTSVAAEDECDLLVTASPPSAPS